MAAPFRVFDSALPDPDCGNLKATIERNYTKLESLFTQLQASEKRLKPLPRMPLPTLSAPYELAAIQALRALGLVEAGALLIEEANWGAVFPVLRALFEVWIALTYAEIMFRRLAIDKSRWNKYDAISTRLIQGRTANFPNDTESEDESRIIYIGNMLDEVKRVWGDGSPEAATALHDHYAELSDYTHPTIWSLAFNMEVRSDGLGTVLHRRALPGGLKGPMSDLDLLLSSSVRALRQLLNTAEEVEGAFRVGPAKDPRAAEAAAKVLEAILSNPPKMSDSELAVLQERGAALPAHFRNRTDEMSEPPDTSS